MDDTALSTGTVQPDQAPVVVATPSEVEHAAVVVAEQAAAADAAIVQDIDELSQADAALASWMGELDEKTDNAIEEVKGLRAWATEFQSSVSAALEGQGSILAQIVEKLSPKEPPETPPLKETEQSASDQTEKSSETESKETKAPEKEKVPLLDENAGGRRKRIGWI